MILSVMCLLEQRCLSHRLSCFLLVYVPYVVGGHGLSYLCHFTLKLNPIRLSKMFNLHTVSSLFPLSFPSSHCLLAARRSPHLFSAPHNEPQRWQQGGRRTGPHAASVSSDVHQDRERLTSQDTLTMTGCRCPKLAGRESNFKDHCVSTHTSHF